MLAGVASCRALALFSSVTSWRRSYVAGNMSLRGGRLASIRWGPVSTSRDELASVVLSNRPCCTGYIVSCRCRETLTTAPRSPWSSRQGGRSHPWASAGWFWASCGPLPYATGIVELLRP